MNWCLHTHTNLAITYGYEATRYDCTQWDLNPDRREGAIIVFLLMAFQGPVEMIILCIRWGKVVCDIYI